MARIEILSRDDVTMWIPADLHAVHRERERTMDISVALWAIASGVWVYDLVTTLQHLFA